MFNWFANWVHEAVWNIETILLDWGVCTLVIDIISIANDANHLKQNISPSTLPLRMFFRYLKIQKDMQNSKTETKTNAKQTSRTSSLYRVVYLSSGAPDQISRIRLDLNPQSPTYPVIETLILCGSPSPIKQAAEAIKRGHRDENNKSLVLPAKSIERALLGITVDLARQDTFSFVKYVLL